jgi:hypothetical protein
MSEELLQETVECAAQVDTLPQTDTPLQSNFQFGRYDPRHRTIVLYAFTSVKCYFFEATNAFNKR